MMSTLRKKKFDRFMSHEWDQHQYAMDLTAELEAETVTVWLDENNMQGDIMVKAPIYIIYLLMKYGC